MHEEPQHLIGFVVNEDTILRGRGVLLVWLPIRAVTIL